jgi:hypothetical protein
VLHHRREGLIDLVDLVLEVGDLSGFALGK